MNKIPYIPFTLFLMISGFSLSTSYADTSSTAPSPTEEEVRDAVVKALLAQENQTKKTVIDPLKKEVTPVASLPDIDQKKRDLDVQALMKQKKKQKYQDVQRAKLQKIVVVANKQLKIQREDKKLLSLPSAKVAEKKDSPDSFKITQIASKDNKDGAMKNGAMTPLIIAEEDEPKTPENVTPEALETKQETPPPQAVKNEAVIKLESPAVAMEDMPVGRNQLATEKKGEFKLSEKKAIEILDISQELVPQLSRNISTSEPELKLNTFDKVAEGRNESAPKKVQGWVYLGRFESGKWENQTLDVEDKLPVVGKQYAIKATSLYVRDATPKKGKMGKIIHAFRTDDTIKVLKLKGLGRNRDFYWAEILRQ